MRERAGPGPGEIQERAFHRWLTRNLPAARSGLLPLGDDAAALRPPPGRVALLSTDTLVEGTHFLAGSPPAAVGAAAAAVSLSDVAAKGARPKGILLALILPVGSDRSWAESVVRGAERLGARFGAHVVGGDTKPGPMRAVVSTVLGWGDPGRLVPRSGARPGDLVGTTGEVGRGGLAAARLARAGNPSRRILVDLLDVRPRVREGIALAPFSHAMIDTSDGIAEASQLLSRSSRVRLEVEEGRLPLARGVRSLARTVEAVRAIAFYGGDYELLATLPPEAWRAAARAVRRSGGRLTRIGRVVRGSGAWLGSAGTLVRMPPAGWQPFAPALSGPA